jgi:hypothetical protein
MLQRIVDALPVVEHAESDAALLPNHLASRSEEQRNALVVRWAQVLDTPAERDEAVLEWFAKHLDAGAIQALSIMTGVCSRAATLAKADRIALLMGILCPPVPLNLIREWVNGEIAAVGDVAAHNTLMRSQALAEADAAAAAAGGSGSAAGAGAAAAADGGGSGAPPPGTGLSPELKLMMQYMASLVPSAQPAVAPLPFTATSGMSPCEKHMAKIIAAIINGNYVDAHGLAVEFLHNLQMQDRTPTSSHEVAPGMFITSANNKVVDTSKIRDPATFAEGMVHYLHLNQLHRPARVPDLLAWWLEVQQDRTMCAVAKVIFCKRFMFRFRSASNWVDLMRMNTRMSIEAEREAARFAAPPAPGLTGRGTKRERERALAAAQPPPNPAPSRRTRRVVLPGAVTPPPVPPVAPRVMKPEITCFSRSDPASTGCKWEPNCIYSHLCATCKIDHAAKDCPAWDPAMTRRNRRA